MEQYTNNSHSGVASRRPKRFFIAISGCAASGKTTIATLLQHVFQGVVIQGRPIIVNVICQDNYARSPEVCPIVHFADPADQYVLHGPGGTTVMKIHSEKPFGIDRPPAGSLTNQQPSELNKVDMSLEMQTLKHHQQNTTLEVSARKRNFNLENTTALDNDVLRSDQPMGPCGSNRNDRLDFEEDKTDVRYADPKDIMPNDELIQSGELRGKTKLSFPPKPLYIFANMDHRTSIDWNRFSADFNFLKDGGTFDQRKAPAVSFSRNSSLLNALEQDLRNSGMLDGKLMVQMRRLVEVELQKIIAENAEARFEGHYVRNGTIEPIVLRGSLLFLEDKPRHRVESLMKESAVKIFLQVSRLQVEYRHTARQFARPGYHEPPTGQRNDAEIWKNICYFDTVTWPYYVSEHKWIFSDQNVESQIFSNDSTVNEAVSSKARHFDIFVWTNEGSYAHTLEGLIHHILGSLKRKVRHPLTHFEIPDLQGIGKA